MTRASLSRTVQQPLFALLGFLLSVGLIGCETNPQTSSALPGPNFAGPVLTPPRYVAPTPPAIKTETPKPEIRPAIGNIPAAWTPLAKAEKRQWQWIVVHHSATANGGASRFDKAHKAQGWDELGYHFVIGNGTDTADGLVEVGGRWPVQKHGAHAKTPDNRYNDYGIGICLVGNFNETRPTAKQMSSLTKLVAFLANKYNIKNSDIIGHKMTGKQTDCPGNSMDITALRAAVARQR
jgi:N-acetyl-anhydromuramyl-L-alanine amidase AmpD